MLQFGEGNREDLQTALVQLVKDMVCRAVLDLRSIRAACSPPPWSWR
jgi:C-terminal processing protease CtpA/Prc